MLQVLRILAAVVRSQGLAARADLEVKVARFAKTSIDALASVRVLSLFPVLALTLEWLGTHS